MANNNYEKLYESEYIKEGDIVSLDSESNKVYLAKNKFKDKDQLVIGICVETGDKSILVANKGICDVNVEGIICLGDKLTTSTTAGKARAIKYERLEERQFGTRSIGKVIGVYSIYNKAKVLLDIE